jgi:hypothetical protein
MVDTPLFWDSSDDDEQGDHPTQPYEPLKQLDIPPPTRRVDFGGPGQQMVVFRPCVVEGPMRVPWGGKYILLSSQQCADLIYIESHMGPGFLPKNYTFNNGLFHYNNSN